MRGMIGKPGAGLCPVRGHSNVQVTAPWASGRRCPNWFLDALDSRFGIVIPARTRL
jgi:formate dehydrogenase major subunit